MTSMPTLACCTALALATLPTIAVAQYEITIDVENPVLMPGESTTVTMFAGFDPDLFAMAAIETDLVASTGLVGLRDAALVAPMNGPGTTAGARSATGYDGILAGQLNFWDVWYADPTNPISFWEVTYTAPREVPAAFDVDLRTVTRRYDVYLEFMVPTSESHLDQLTEGSATIRVIPAPASASLLGLGLLAAARRRR